MNAKHPALTFTESLIEKDVFEREILMLLGRDLHLSQSFALEQCRNHVETILTMWLDGFSIQATFEHLKGLLIEAAKTDEELKWQINPDVLNGKASNYLSQSIPTEPAKPDASNDDEESFGTVKWYSSKKGFGFIQSDEIDEDIFVHHKEINGSGFKKLSPGEDVLFELSETERGYEALNVKRA